MTTIRRRLILLTIGFVCALAIWIAHGLLTYVIGFDYTIPLPGNYELVRVYAGTVVLCDPENHVILDPNVDGYAICGDLILGHVSKHPAPEYRSLVGYFVVNTKSGEKATGLSKSDYLAELRRHGIRGAPALHRPSRWRAIVEYLKP